MGIRRDDFAIIGVRFDFGLISGDRHFDELCDQYYWKDASPGDFVIVADGMDGKYVVAGILIEHADENGFSLLELDPSDAVVETVERRVQEILGYQMPVQAIVFSHWH